MSTQGHHMASRTLQFFDVQSAKDAVRDIHRLRRHHETTIFERHSGSVGQPPSSEYKKITILCEKLADTEMERFATFCDSRHFTHFLVALEPLLHDSMF